MRPNHRYGNSRPRRREFVILSGACLTALLSVFLLLPQFKASSQQGPQRERLIDTKGPYPDCPIKIVGVETSKRKVVLGKSFLDDDDWMKGLTVGDQRIGPRWDNLVRFEVKRTHPVPKIPDCARLILLDLRASQNPT